MEETPRDNRIEKLAREILLLSRNTLLVHLRFLDSAVSRLPLVETDEGHMGTNGQVIRYNPKHILQTYFYEQDRIARDYLHTLLHCTFRHAFLDPQVDRDCWDLATDIAAECAIDSMELSCVSAERQRLQTPILARLTQDGVMLTAEKIYRYYLNQKLTPEELETLREPFFADDHDMWYAPFHESEGEEERGEEAEEEPPEPEEEENPGKPDKSDDEAAPSGGDEEQPSPSGPEPDAPERDEEQENGADESPGEEEQPPAEGQPEQEEAEQDTPETNPEQTNRRGKQQEHPHEGEDKQPDDAGEKAAADMESGEGEGGTSAGGTESEAPDQQPLTKQELKELWSDIARHIKVDMETGPKMRGDKAGAMLQNLKAVTRETYDYSDFLRQFAVPGETVQLNDDEFDYIYYTYGLDLYGKMPLIEPLEYKEVKRIREFVIAIDTSGSVKGDQVQRFIEKTYNILMEQESFFTKINLHIIQCDAAIQEVRKITTREEFDAYLADMTLQGFGGTDFRPVFAYVDRMLGEKEFTNLKGLIYFTDGQGVYPAEKPAYDAAFVFVREDYEIPKVPVWAIRLVLDKNEL